MNENQHFTDEEQRRAAEGRQVQQELERQLRAFGDTMSEAFRHGFEGRGENIGDKAYDVGRAAVNAANFGLNEAARALRTSRDEAAKSDRQPGAKAPRWSWPFGKKEQSPVEKLRAGAKKCHDAGSALLVVGIVFAVIFGIGGIACFATASSFSPQIVNVIRDVVIVRDTVTGGVVVSPTELLQSVGSMALSGIQVAGGVLSAIALGFAAQIAAGANRLSAAKKLGLYADLADGVDYKNGLSLSMLAYTTAQKPKKVRKDLRKFIRKGWLSAWLDERAGMLYLTAEDYRAAQTARQEQPVSEPQPQPEGTAPDLETVRSFARVLEQEQRLMQDERAVEELVHMKKTTAAICSWLEAHPESLPKARRFEEYYIPTTLKLLHTYNDVQNQRGSNAESIRRDIAGILHTLNQGYDTLYDKLLSDVALDVSGEIAALQGMLANDGLAGEGLL